MSNDPRNPEVGELSIDATSLTGVIVDLPPKGMLGLRREQDGLTDVLQEITANQATYGGRAGITTSDFDQLNTINANISAVQKYLGPARKLVELLEETEAALDDSRHKIISTVAMSIDQRAKSPGNEDLMAYYEKTRAYRSAIAVKAAKTRKKNEEAEQEVEQETAP